MLTKKLLEVSGKIEAADNVEEILRDHSQDICDALEADRLTIYLVNEDKTLIVSKIKTGLDAHEDLKLPISSEYSIAGYAARNKRVINIKNVYDITAVRTLNDRNAIIG